MRIIHSLQMAAGKEAAAEKTPIPSRNAYRRRNLREEQKEGEKKFVSKQYTRAQESETVRNRTTPDPRGGDDTVCWPRSNRVCLISLEKKKKNEILPDR